MTIIALKKSRNNHEEISHDEGRRDFLKQSSLLTALAVAPPFLVKAGESVWNEKAAANFEKLPLTLEVNGISHYPLSLV